jgi:transcription antitermination factor NusG
VTEKGGALPPAILSDKQSSTGRALEVERAFWFAVQTRPHHEKKVSAELTQKGLHSFLPVQRQRRQWSDRQKWIELPLFSNYVFVRMAEDPELRTRVLRTMGVVRFAGAPGHGTSIPDEQIHNLQTIVNQRIPLMPHSYINVGEKVRICGGALHGMEGVLVAIRDGRRFVVSVDLIQRSVAIQLEGFEVERV